MSDLTHRPDGHPSVRQGKVGVLLINLGTPDGPDTRSVRRYLAEFLSDPRIIEVPQLLWQPVLRGIILTTRPPRTAHAYGKVWDRETDESPLRRITRAQCEAVAGRMAGEPALILDWAMRYGHPSISERLDALIAEGCERVLLAPLYPQYSATTTASVMDKVAQALGRMRHQPAIRTLPPFYDDPAYVDALVRAAERQLSALDFEPEILLASFHGLPKRYFEKGDPYHCHSMKTARLLREGLGLAEERFRVTFQSRFGPTEWLQPYTDETVAELAASGVKRLAITMPGFVADCLETLEEIGIGIKAQFLEAGGEHFAALPCLNAGAESTDMLETLIRRELAGWI